jgi:hypothetical protein
MACVCLAIDVAKTLELTMKLTESIKNAIQSLHLSRVFNHFIAFTHFILF